MGSDNETFTHFANDVAEVGEKPSNGEIFRSAIVQTLTAYGNTTSLNTSTLRYEREEDICSTKNGRAVTFAEMIACAIAVLTVLENCLVLTAIAKGHRNLRKPPYWFIASLALADLFAGLEVVLAIFIPIGSSPLSRIALKGVAVVTFIASVNSLLFVSVDRYIRIVRHAEYKKYLSRKRIVALILFSWMMPFTVFLMVPLLGWSCSGVHCCAHDGLCSCLRSQHGDSVCGRRCSQSFVPFTKSYLLIGVMYFAFSVAVVVVFYGVIFKAVKKKTFVTGEGRSQWNKRRDIQLAKTIALTLGIFVLCWLPVLGLFIADLTVTERSDALLKAFDFALVPSIINSFMNPIIYSVRLPYMRTTMQQLFLPCIFHESKTKPNWASFTSMENRSFRRIPSHLKLERKIIKRASISSEFTSRSRPLPTRKSPNNSTTEISPIDFKA